jgi:hypothetical protein
LIQKNTINNKIKHHKTMSTSSKRVALKGSNLSLPSEETPIGDVDPDEQMEVTVVLHPSAQLAKDVDEMNKIPVSDRNFEWAGNGPLWRISGYNSSWACPRIPLIVARVKLEVVV